MKENSCHLREEITRGKSHLRRADTIQDGSGTEGLYLLTAEYTRITAETEAEAERSPLLTADSAQTSAEAAGLLTVGSALTAAGLLTAVW